MTDAEPAPPGFVPPGFVPPDGLDHPGFRLRPRGPEHNASDYAAWTSSIDHIRSTPGFPDGDWPHPMTLEENRGDLVRHAADFEARRGFTYTVLAPDDADPPTVIGCLYIYPGKGVSASVQSWVRAADAALDGVLAAAVSAWLAGAWPFERPDYVGRDAG
jgi:hypothetical protein